MTLQIIYAEICFTCVSWLSCYVFHLKNIYIYWDQNILEPLFIELEIYLVQGPLLEGIELVLSM